MPEGVGLAEEGSQADGHGRGDGAFAVDDLFDRLGRDADGACHRVLGDAHGGEVFLEEDTKTLIGAFQKSFLGSQPERLWL